MKKYNRYKFKSGADLVKGEKPDFFQLLTKYVKPDMFVLDLGCGSGELANQLAHRCQKIIGIDTDARYIKTAKQDKKNKKLTNIFFKISDAQKLPFNKNTFDLIYSSRGPLSASAKFLREASRVLKTGGFLIEETIGETDKKELKKIFKRGQNFPYKDKKLVLVKRLLSKFKIKLIYSKNFIYYQRFPSLALIIRILERAPIIPNFDRCKDQSSVSKIKSLDKGRGLILSAHRLWWVGQKS